MNYNYIGKGYVGFSKSNNSSCFVNLHSKRYTGVLKTASVSCSTNRDCLPSYYCDGANCQRCHGSCDWCNGANDTNCTKCSRFSVNWKNVSNAPPSRCNLEYFNLGIFNSADYNFTGLTPIRTGRATMGLWIHFGILNVSTNLFHIVLQDYFVMSFLTSNSSKNVEVYCSANHIFHNRMTTLIEDTTTTNFSTVVATYTTADWTTKVTITNLQKRWVYVRCGVDYMSDYLFVDWVSNIGSPNSPATQPSGTANKTIKKEKIYNLASIGFQDFRYFKFYKSADTLSVYFKNINSFTDSSPVFMQNLYIFSELMEKIQNLQY